MKLTKRPRWMTQVLLTSARPMPDLPWSRRTRRLRRVALRASA